MFLEKVVMIFSENDDWHYYVKDTSIHHFTSQSKNEIIFFLPFKSNLWKKLFFSFLAKDTGGKKKTVVFMLP